MKNKHLVLLFLATLVGGRLLLNKLPLPNNAEFRKTVLTLDSTKISGIEIVRLPQGDTLFLSKNESDEWVATDGERSTKIEKQLLSPIFKNLAAVEATQFLEKTAAQNFQKQRTWQVSIFENDKKSETTEWGSSDEKNALLRLPNSPDVFVVAGDPTAAFQLKLNDLRSKKIAVLPDTPTVVVVECRELLTLVFEKKDTFWVETSGKPQVGRADFEKFLEKIRSLCDLPFASDFDETLEKELLFGRVKMEFSASPPLIISGFLGVRRGQFFIHSSQNPDNFFEIADSLGEQIFTYPKNWLPK